MKNELTNPNYYYEVEQGTDDWHGLRRGKITASTIKAMLTATGKIADNETSRKAVNAIVAERLFGYSEVTPTTSTMQRGHDDETLARDAYSAAIGEVTECGFVERDIGGVLIGCSPDGLVGDTGGIEIKSRLHSIQIQTIIDGKVPPEFMAQIQTCMMVTKREWWDFISVPAFGGAKMMVKTVTPDLGYMDILAEAAAVCEERVKATIEKYKNSLTREDTIFIDVDRRMPEPSDDVQF